MSNRRTEHDHEPEELLMGEDFDYEEISDSEVDQDAEQPRQPRFSMSLRHRIEERLEERRLRRELDDYESLDPDGIDDNTLH